MSGNFQERIQNLLKEFDLNGTTNEKDNRNQHFRTDSFRHQQSSSVGCFNQQQIGQQSGRGTFKNFSLNYFEEKMKKKEIKSLSHKLDLPKDYVKTSMNSSRDISISDFHLNTQPTTSSISSPCRKSTQHCRQSSFEPSMSMSNSKIQKEISLISKNFITNGKSYINRPMISLESPHLLISETRKEYFNISPTRQKQKSLVNPKILKIFLSNQPSFRQPKEKNETSAEHFFTGRLFNNKNAKEEQMNTFLKGFEIKKENSFLKYRNQNND